MNGENGLKEKISKMMEDVEMVYGKYFEIDCKSSKVPKEERFIAICDETEVLKTKLAEEQQDNRRLVEKLNGLDSELSSLLVNHIGSSISQECDYVEANTNILKEKTTNCLNQANIVQNSVEGIYYGDDNKNDLLKIKELLLRKIQDNKKEKERLIVQQQQYEVNKTHLRPLLHQYTEILKESRNIDRQVSQLLS
mmetsp:Transcript_24037/g.21356  ORF Transcript_24037/g.21356 Transcript_24037/m.21356 type:complete len:195 (-) Transcript_24037:27-611(-)